MGSNWVGLSCTDRATVTSTSIKRIVFMCRPPELTGVVLVTFTHYLLCRLCLFVDAYGDAWHIRALL